MGLAKGGLTGVSALSVPIMTLMMSPVQAAAITLPILIAQDLVSVWIFRGQWDRRLVAILLAGGVIGVALGWALAAYVSSSAVEFALGVVSVLFGAQRLWVERRGLSTEPKRGGVAAGVVLGAAGGFTSQIAHAGGPPVQIYLMPLNLSRDALIGTMTLFFMVINWVKVPAYFALGQFTKENLTLSAVMLPLAVISTYFGARLARRFASANFYRFVYALLILVGLKLAWDGWAVLSAG